MLIIKDLSHKYDKHEVLSSINFEVPKGEFLSILGPSGCGKTTMLRLLTGLILPQSGSISLDGVDITYAHPSARKMGIVFQNYALFESMTVLGNVEYALKIKKSTKAIARETAMKMINHLGLTDQLDKRPMHLSGGQQQRVAIARTLVVNPEIILFDEPMSNLDIETRLSLRSVIKGIQKEFETTMIYVTHDQEEAFAMSDKIMVLEQGKIAQIDTPQNIIDSPANEYVKSFVVDNLKQKANELRLYLGGNA